MRTVSAIISSVYQKDANAARALRVTPPAVWNWKAQGYFPARVVAPIFEHARERGIQLDISEIPTMEKVRGDA